MTSIERLRQVVNSHDNEYVMGIDVALLRAVLKEFDEALGADKAKALHGLRAIKLYTLSTKEAYIIHALGHICRLCIDAGIKEPYDVLLADPTLAPKPKACPTCQPKRPRPTHCDVCKKELGPSFIWLDPKTAICMECNHARCNPSEYPKV